MSTNRHGAGAQENLDAEVASTDLRDGVASHVVGQWRQGLIRFGAFAILDGRGSAMMMIGDDNPPSNATIEALSARFELLSPEAWAMDRSGAVVRLGRWSRHTSERSPLSAIGGSARLIGALVLASGAEIDAADSEDEIIALARHVVEHGLPSERLPLLRAVKTVGSGTPGVRLLLPEELPNLARILESSFLQGVGVARFSPPFPIKSTTPPMSLSLVDDVWFRGSAHDYLQRSEDVLVIRRDGEGVTLEVLTGEARALWNHADGRSREELLSMARGESALSGSGQASLESTFDKLCQSGMLSREPSWAMRPNVAHSSNGSQVRILAAAGREALPLALDGPAAFIWLAMVERPYLTITDIVALCAKRYEVDVDTARTQVRQLMLDLHQRDLIGWV